MSGTAVRRPGRSEESAVGRGGEVRGTAADLQILRLRPGYAESFAQDDKGERVPDGGLCPSERSEESAVGAGGRLAAPRRTCKSFDSAPGCAGSFAPDDKGGRALRAAGSVLRTLTDSVLRGPRSGNSG